MRSRQETGDALREAGHQVVLTTGALTKSPWQTAAPLDVQVVHVPPGADIVHVSSRMRAYAAAIGAPATAAGEVRRVLFNQELLTQLRQRFEHDPPDLVYERASLFGVAGLTFAREAGGWSRLPLRTRIVVTMSYPFLATVTAVMAAMLMMIGFALFDTVRDF